MEAGRYDAVRGTLTGRDIVWHWIRRLFAGIVLSAAAIYALDYLVLQLRVVENWQAFGKVTVRPYYAIKQKDQKVELDFEDPQEETCVNSLLPHFNDDPCWYLVGHPEKRIEM